MYVSAVGVREETSAYLSDFRVRKTIEMEFLYGVMDRDQGVLICDESLAIVSLNCIVPPLLLNDA